MSDEGALVGDRAVVLGASIAGLLAARVLSDRYREVVVLDRDELGAYGEYRKGVPQARHAHGLLAGGSRAIEELLPGCTDALLARGAMRADVQAVGTWVNEGHALCHGRSGLDGVLVSRLLLEDEIRSRVASIDNVTIRPRSEALGLRLGPDGVVRGVRVADRTDGGTTETIDADLVVDASGRGSRLPSWLQDLGFGAPPIEEIVVGLAYTTLEFERPEPDGDCGFIVVAPTAARPRSGVLLPQPEGRWVVTVGGYLGDAAPGELAGLRAFASGLPSTHLTDAMDGLVPVGEARTFKYHASAWRRYDRMRRFPGGLLVVGDAMCSFNPIFGQGMTVAAREALLLRDCLAAGATRSLARRFFRRAAAAIAVPWEIAASSDLRLPAVQGRRTAKARLTNRYLRSYFKAAAHDEVLSRRFLLVVNLLARPESLLSPSSVLRVVRGARRSPAGEPAQEQLPALAG